MVKLSGFFIRIKIKQQSLQPDSKTTNQKEIIMLKDEFPQTLYEKLLNEEDARVCKNISEDACKEVPGNFLLMIISSFFSKLGDAIANPKVVLPWVMETINAPLYLIGFLVPIRESGSLIPQLLIASYIRLMPVRKWVWVGGSILQAVAMVGIGLVAWTSNGTMAGYAIIGLLVIFSLARGLSSVASKDVVGKTIPKTQRGRVTGWSASLAGLITVLIGGVFLFISQEALSPLIYGAMLAGAGLLWIIAALVYAGIKEYPGATDGGGNALFEALKRLRILRDDKPFRRFVITRSLLLCSALTAPYYVVLAQQYLGSPTYLLGLFVLASGAASLLSAPFWGHFADLSSRKVMIAAAIMTAALGLIVYTIDQLVPQLLQFTLTLPLVYFLLSIAHQGVRVGRKTYVVDLAEGNKRTDYVSVSNTLIGIILLILGFTGALSTVLEISSIILILSLMGVIGAILAVFLPEVE